MHASLAETLLRQRSRSVRRPVFHARQSSRPWLQLLVQMLQKGTALCAACVLQRTVAVKRRASSVDAEGKERDLTVSGTAVLHVLCRGSAQHLSAHCNHMRALLYVMVDASLPSVASLVRAQQHECCPAQGALDGMLGGMYPGCLSGCAV